MGKIIYLGHASFLLESKEFKIVIDPYGKSSVPHMEFPKLKEEVDGIFCSHEHFDHSARSLVPLKRQPCQLRPVLSLLPHDHVNGRQRGLCTARMFIVDGVSVAHLGDIGCVPEEKLLAPFKNCDILLAPINGFFTINPEELKAVVDIIQPRIVIPMHYYMKEYDSGYPDKGMIDEFEKLFPNHQYLESEELDLDTIKGYTGALIFKKYLQD